MCSFQSVNSLNRKVNCGQKLQNDVVQFAMVQTTSLTICASSVCMYACVCVCVPSATKCKCKLTMVLFQCMVFIMRNNNTQTVPHVL